MAAVLALAATAARAQSPARPQWAAELDSIVRSELARTRTPGAAVAVVVDGKLAYAAGYGVANIESGQAVTAETLFRVGSVTKMFTGATIAKLALDGTVALDAPIGTYVRELKGRVAQVTLHQLLTHTAGWIDNAVAYGRMGESALGEVMREVTDTMFLTDPERVLSYSNPGYSMAGYVAEAGGGARYATLVTNTVLRPTGMTRSTFKPLEALTWPAAMGHMPGATPTLVRPFTENTAQWPAGFLFSTAPELARFTMMLMNGGTIDGRTVLAPAVIARVTGGFVPMPGTLPGDSARYGYGIVSARRGGERVWQHGGSINGFDANVIMLPDRKSAVVMFDNMAGAPMTAVVDAALRLTTGVTLPAPALPPARNATPAERAALVGRYATRAVQVEIAEEGEALVFRQNGASLALQLAGTNGIVITPPAGAPLRMAFVLGADGKAAYLHQASRALPRQR